jgi:serine/threonine protein kinase/Tfp pilus assembly protein PilF
MMNQELSQTVVTAGRKMDWKADLLASMRSDARLDQMQEAARQFQSRRQQADGKGASLFESWSQSGEDGPQAKLFGDLHRLDAAAAERLSRAVTSLPEEGTDFLGFRLLAVLGQGAFGQVYLAEQGDLANRPVALKVSADVFGESQALAQLQHTNIVPVYSIHRADPFQAVCMPYFGATTLADVLEHLEGGQSLPASGNLLVSTIHDRRLSTRHALSHRSIRSASQPQSPEVEHPAEERPTLAQGAEAAQALQKLEGMTYVEAVLWMVARLAEGLAHAHERGILHHDLKPANILLTDDGQPMLLDFNLSEDTKLRTSVAAASIGGTLPYMAPEHLEAFCGSNRTLDARCDVYSLGVIFYELLTSKRPFPAPGALGPGVLQKMIEDRRQPLADPRRWNAAVSPAVASIVQRCLEADPNKRYQSARELAEDLERQLHDHPLKHAPEKSWRERAHKWSRRHPRLASTTSISILLGTLILVLTTAFVMRGRRLVRLEAQESLGQFQEEMQTAQFLLYSQHADRSQLEDGMSQCRATLARFDILDNPHWSESSQVRALPDAEQQRLQEEAGELLYLLAKATALYAQYYTEEADRPSKLQEAQQFNLLAEACYGQDQAPRALWEQRANLARLLGQGQEAEILDAKSAQLTESSAKDDFLIAHRLAIEGRHRQALELLQRATQQDPRSFPAWFVRGNCYYDLLQDVHAVACFNTCVALRPEYHWCWFNRGLAHLRLRNFRQAMEDFDQVVRLRPEQAEGYINRALAKEGLQKYAEAVADYTRALAQEKVSTRVYFLRAEARARAGDKPGAERDYDKGLAWEPTDEQSWVARGLARRESDPAGALADFEQALKLNPRSFEGLQNKAAILVDKFNQDAKSLQVMEEAVKLYPDSILARGGRGVLLARTGKRAAALEDAQAALLLDTSPSTLYQVACIYALTSRTEVGDRLQALHLLSSALRGGFGLDLVDKDSDLDPLRNLPEFKRLLTAVRALETDSAQAPRGQNGS